MYNEITYQSLITLIILFVVIIFLKTRAASPRAVLLCALVLIGAAVSHVFFISNIEVVLEALVLQNRLSPEDQQLAKVAITKWNLIIPLLVGGLGVNMLNTWLTFGLFHAHDKKLSHDFT